MEKPMKDTYTVSANHGEPETIEAKELNLICPANGVDVAVLDEDVVTITPQMTLSVVDEMAQEDWDVIRVQPEFIKMFKMVFPDFEVPENPKRDGMGVQHVIGLILCTAEVLMQNKRPYYKYPETYLHPKAQLGLADLFVYLSTGNYAGKQGGQL